MELIRPNEADWKTFLQMADCEGWTVPDQEVALLKGPLAEGTVALRMDGRMVAFVSAVCHGRSGWVGNLLMHPDMRGRGLGRRLFDHTLELLERKGAKEIWLTASKMGRPLYERSGFVCVNRTVRWKCSGGLGGGQKGQQDAELLIAADSHAWGEERRSLLEPLAASGLVFAEGSSAALLQGGEGEQVIGPWLSGSLCPMENRSLLTAILEAAAPDRPLVVDLLDTSPVRTMLVAAGFERQGSSDLMVRGESASTFQPGLVALASLGSIG